MLFTLQYSFKGMGRNSVLYNSAFSHLANRIKFGNVADIPISCMLMSSLLKCYIIKEFQLLCLTLHKKFKLTIGKLTE